MVWASSEGAAMPSTYVRLIGFSNGTLRRQPPGTRGTGVAEIVR